MTIKPIQTDAEYQAALAQIEASWDAVDCCEKAEQLEVLSMLVDAYEKRRYPVEAPDPIEYLNYVIETRGMARKDFVPYIGSRGRVSDILNRVRPLSLVMIRRLSSVLGLPALLLIKDYQHRQQAV